MIEHCPYCGRYTQEGKVCCGTTKQRIKKHYRNTFPNERRSKEERKARYCFLRHTGLNRKLARQVGSYRDDRIVMFLQNNLDRLNGATSNE